MELPITPKELERQAALCLQGRAYSVALCLNSGSLTIASTRAAWLATEIVGNGYARHTGTLGTGAWNGTTLRYELPQVTPSFTATGAGYVFDTVVVLIGTEDYPLGVLAVGSTALQAGQVRTFPLTLAQKSAA
jgi:hypothetical protein